MKEADKYLIKYHNNNQEDWLFKKRHVVAQLMEEYASQSKPQEIEWLSSEIKPESDKPVLAIIESGKYPVRVMWVKEHSISTEDWEFHGAEDYNETDDKYYWPEGWYEWNEMEEVHWMCKDVLLWTELPIYDKSELQTRIKPVDTKTVDAVEFLHWVRENDFVYSGGAGWYKDEFDIVIVNALTYITDAELLNIYIESKK